MVKHIRYLLQGALLALAVVLVQSPHLVAAGAAYGRGTYGDCSYTKCTPPPVTIVTVPPNLDVAINLQDGQTIPNDQYTVQATPLNGQGSSFDHIDFYVNDQLLTTVKPDETGTASWVWNTHDNPGDTVKIVITGTDGQTVTKTYHVRISATTGPASPSQTQSSGPAARRPQSPLESVINGATRIIAGLPMPFIRTFPYGLFLILLGNFVLLALQLRKELREYELAKQLLVREREVAGAKHVLLQLLSHYLRTPLTVINGGIDMLADKTGAVWKPLRQSLSENVELLINQTRSDASAVDALPAIERRTMALHFWRRPGLLVPIVLIGVVVVAFDYLAHRASRLNLSQTNIAGQVLAFSSLAILTYAVFRLLQLRRQDAQEMERIVAAEGSLAQARDNLVAEGVGLLQRTVHQIDAQSANLPPEQQATRFIDEGRTRLRELLQKFQLAASVRSTRIDKPVATVPFRDLLERASASLGELAAKRHIELPAGTDQMVPVRDPDLLVRVVGSVLDNAVAYSQDGAHIEAECQTDKDMTVLTIVDHGKGIPVDRLKSLFAPFQKLEGAETFDHEGMGFSLYLDRLIMTYLGGSINIVSSQTDGTRVRLALPNTANSQA